MAEKVGEIYYSVTLETQDLLNKARQVDKQITGLATRFSEVGAAVKALFLGMSVLTVIDTADQWGQYASRIKMATKSTEEYNLVQALMLASANKTYRSINETREGFTTCSQNLGPSVWAIHRPSTSLRPFRLTPMARYKALTRTAPLSRTLR